MAKFTLIREWSGYSRGTEVVVVEAESREAALADADDNWDLDGERTTVRDDTEAEEWRAV